MKDTKLREIREEKRKAIDAQDLASEKEWTAKELAYLQGCVDRLPESTKKMRSLLALLKREERRARREGDFSKVEEYKVREEELENRILSANPEDQTMIRSLLKRTQKRIQKAMEDGDTEAIKRYEKQKSELEKRRRPKGQKVEPVKDIPTREIEVFPIAKVRELIYGSDDVIQVAEEIKKQMGGVATADSKFLLAELYFHTGFTRRAQGLLKVYKRELSENGENVKLVNLGLAVAMNSRTNKFSWDEFWRKKAELEQRERMLEQEEEEKG